MNIRTYIQSLGKDPSILGELAVSYGFDLRLFDRVDEGIQGLPLDIANALAQALGLSLGDILSNVPRVAPQGRINYKPRGNATLQLIPLEGDKPLLEITYPALDLAPTQQPPTTYRTRT